MIDFIKEAKFDLHLKGKKKKDIEERKREMMPQMPMLYSKVMASELKERRKRLPMPHDSP